MSTAVAMSIAAESEASDDPQATTDQHEATLDASQENIDTLHQDLYDPDGRLDDRLFACEASGAVEDSDRGPSSPVVQSRSETPVTERAPNSRRTVATLGTIAAIAIAGTAAVFPRPSFEPRSPSEGLAVRDLERDPDPLVPAATVGTSRPPRRRRRQQTLLLSAGP